MNVLDGLLVKADVAHRVDAPGQYAAFRCHGSYPEVGDHHRIDTYRVRVVLIPGVDRNEIHAHGRLAWTIAAIGRVHGSHPVEDLWGPWSFGVSTHW